MAEILASGQLTLTDLNDTRQYILYLNSNYKTQIYDPNTGAYSPNLSSSNLVIDPQLYVSGGDGSDLIPSANVKSISWYEGTDTTAPPLAETSTSGTTSGGLTYVIPTGTLATTKKTLTIKSNLTSMNNQVFTCKVVYTDPGTNFDITIVANAEIVKITNGQKGATGASGVDAYFLNVWAPSGDTIRNSSGSLTLTADLYKGSSKITPTAFKWYIQNPAATTSSLGDADGGAGWELLTSTNTHGTSNYTTGTITVPASAIDGVEGFKCVATAPSTGTKYSGVIVVRDFQDPITVNIVGTNIFKNGTGSVTLTAQLIQAGVVIPTTGYTFTWALYDSNGSLIKNYTNVTGDTITIPATDVNGTGNLVCDVSK